MTRLSPLGKTLRPAFTALALMLFLITGQVWAGPPLPVVTVTSADQAADEAGQDIATFTVTLDQISSQALSVNLAITGSATRNVDYDLPGILGGAPLAIIIPANTSSVSFTVTPRLDNSVEGPESVVVALQTGTDYDLGMASTVQLSIADDVPEITLTRVGDGAMAELGQVSSSFRVERSNNGDISRAITVNIDIAGTATRNVDYSSPGVFGGAPLAVSIAGGDFDATFVLTPNVDNLVEGSETVTVALQPSAAVYTVGTQLPIDFTIADDVPEVNLTLIDGVMAEQDQDPGSFRVTRSNNGDISRAITVNIEVTGTATRGVDYNSGSIFGGAPLAVSIAANELEVITTLTPVADGPDNEDDETISVTLQPGANYTVGSNTSAMLTLADLIDALFADSFEDPVSGKICALGKSLDQSRFFDQGASVLDLNTGLTWSKCGPTKSYQWDLDECAEIPSPLNISVTDQLLLFNEGFIGDNAGFSDWRRPNAAEQTTLSSRCQNLVR
ncbi:MAG: hypothetical protein AB8B96_17995 [Lysobacterales bacterium]